jgi:hypothetical protein
VTQTKEDELNFLKKKALAHLFGSVTNHIVVVATATATAPAADLAYCSIEPYNRSIQLK